MNAGSVQGATLGWCSVGFGEVAMSNHLMILLLLAMCSVLVGASHLRSESPRDIGVQMAELVKGVDSTLAKGGVKEASEFETSLFSEVASKQDVLVIAVFQFMLSAWLGVAECHRVHGGQ